MARIDGEGEGYDSYNRNPVSPLRRPSKGPFFAFFVIFLAHKKISTGLNIWAKNTCKSSNRAEKDARQYEIEKRWYPRSSAPLKNCQSQNFQFSKFQTAGVSRKKERDHWSWAQNLWFEMLFHMSQRENLLDCSFMIKNSKKCYFENVRGWKTPFYAHFRSRPSVGVTPKRWPCFCT